MGTNSTIVAALPNGGVISSTVNFDGYLEGVGRTLADKYTNTEIILELIALGDLSSLDDSHLAPPGHSYRTPIPGCSVAYHRDRGEDWEEVMPMRYATWEMVGLSQHNYFWDGQQWLYRRYHAAEWRSLTSALAELDN